MKKKERILNAMHELLLKGHAGTASVQDIANQAGIAKGGLYYYFESKESVLDALVEREYAKIISTCRSAIEAHKDIDALSQLKLLLFTYRNSTVDAALDSFLHHTDNAAIHQKSLAYILTTLSPIVSGIIQHGVDQNVFQCEYPEEYANILLSVLVFSLDAGIFSLTMEIVIMRLKALAHLLECGLCSPVGSFSFLYDGWTKLRLSDLQEP